MTQFIKYALSFSIFAGSISYAAPVGSVNDVKLTVKQRICTGEIWHEEEANAVKSLCSMEDLNKNYLVIQKIQQDVEKTQKELELKSKEAKDNWAEVTSLTLPRSLFFASALGLFVGLYIDYKGYNSFSQIKQSVGSAIAGVSILVGIFATIQMNEDSPSEVKAKLTQKQMETLQGQLQDLKAELGRRQRMLERLIVLKEAP